MIDKIIGNFKITDFLEEGGMGKVYLARQLTFDREVAIKILDPSLSKNPQFKERFINEANALAKLNHTNIVSIYDFVEYEGNYCIIMEYVKGTTLDKIIENNDNVDISLSINIINQLLDGLSYAHKQSIVHRDIKPSNVIIDSDKRVKILDFGIAKMVLSNSNLTKTGTRMGSICYMSPEQILGKDLNLKTDIYSAGITFYELLSGQLPYDIKTESDYIVQNKIVNDALPDIRTLNPAVPRNIADAINISTLKNPDDRFIDCDEFKKYISEFDLLSNNRDEIIHSLRNQTQNVNTTHNNNTVYIQPNNINEKYNSKLVNNKLVFGVFFLVLIIAIGVIYYFNSEGNNKYETTEQHSHNSLNEETKNKSEDVYLTEAKTMLDEKKYDESIKNYRDFIKDYPKSDKAIFAFNQIAGIQIDALKNPQEGIKTYKELADKFPSTKEAKQGLFMVAFIYDETLKDKEKAIKSYQTFLKKYPTDTDPNDKMSESAKTMLAVLQSGKSIEEMIQENIEKMK